MHGKNVKKGQSVLFLGENCIRFPEVYAACAYLGAVFQPINPNLETSMFFFKSNFSQFLFLHINLISHSSSWSHCHDWLFTNDILSRPLHRTGGPD